jgi:hypothetical protein
MIEFGSQVRADELDEGELGRAFVRVEIGEENPRCWSRDAEVGDVGGNPVRELFLSEVTLESWISFLAKLITFTDNTTGDDDLDPLGLLRGELILRKRTWAALSFA